MNTGNAALVSAENASGATATAEKCAIACESCQMPSRAVDRPSRAVDGSRPTSWQPVSLNTECLRDVA
jgi:uncharacterized protein (DUF2126 family)